jgi:hypothetical protein
MSSCATVTDTALAAALPRMARSAPGSMSPAVTDVAPAFAAAIATTPEPEAASSTCLPRTTEGLSRM